MPTLEHTRPQFKDLPAEIRQKIDREFLLEDSAWCIDVIESDPEGKRELESFRREKAEEAGL